MNIDLSKNACIFGETQSGKTILANYLFQDTGGLFIDISDMGDIEADIEFNHRKSVKNFFLALKYYRRVRYVPISPQRDRKKSLKEIKIIWELLCKLNKNIYVYVDEIQNWGTSRRNEYDVYATEGLKRGVHIISITQRPANISKTLASQSKTHIFFDIGEFEAAYYKKHQLPYEKILNSLYKKDETGEWVRKAPYYAFVVYQRGRGLSRPIKLSI